MKSKTKKRLIIFISIISAYFIFCTGLFFFEPISYNAPDLTEFQYLFDSYKKYDISENSDFYIKQITKDDIATSDVDIRIKYVANTIIAIADNQYHYSDVTTLLKNFNCNICGYIEDVNLYQIEFYDNLSFNELNNMCDALMRTNVFTDAIPDFFEETPASEFSTDEYNSTEYYYDMVDLYKIWDLFDKNESVNIGIMDFYADNESKFLNIVNKNEYSVDSAYGDTYSSSSVSHGTHVAGIIGASHDSDSPGVVNNARIYSYNGINVSTSYWIASICDMIINNNIKTINISMAYNSYITMSAASGCENAIKHIQNECDFFSTLLSDLIDSGYEFVICAAAGNDAESSVYKSFGTYFSYGDKKILDAVDIFGIFDTKPDYVDAKYAFFFSNITDKNVRDRIIIVGSIDDDYNYSDFSNSGNVDIVAPGEHIYSTTMNNNYNYMSGTSMSTPFVTGTAAMIFSVDPELTGAEVKNIILTSAKYTASDGQYTYPVLNVYEAVKYAVEHG